MANKRISDLAADTSPANNDLLATVDVSDTSEAATGTNKKVTPANLTKALSTVVGDSGSGGTKGLVPAPGAGDAAANKFLHADGTFKTPAGSGAIGGSTGSTDNALIRADGTGGSTIQSSAITVDDSGATTIPEISAPSTPASGKVAVYAKSDHKVYRKDSTGTETELGGGGLTINSTTNVIPQKSGASSFGDSYLTHDSGSTQTQSAQDFSLVSGKALHMSIFKDQGALKAGGTGWIKVTADGTNAGAIISNFRTAPNLSNTITPFASQGMNLNWTLVANTTVANPINNGGDGTAPDGYRFVLRLVQDGTGGWTVTWGSDYKFPGGTAPTMTAAANAIDIYEFIVYSDIAYLVSKQQDVK